MTTATLSMQLATDQVLSWLHDEESTVTSQKIQQDCIAETSGGEEAGVSRYQASLLLQDLYDKNPHQYIATVVREQSGKCPANKETEAESIPVTTFSCRQLSPGESLNDTTTNSTTLLALAPKSSTSSTATEALESVHESDMANLRDRLSKNSDQHNPEWFYNHQDLSEIQMATNLGTAASSLPSATPEKTWHKLEKDGPIVRKTAVVSNTNNKSNKSKVALKNSSNTNKAVVKTTKPTTAQSFFTKKPSANDNSSSSKNAARSSSSSSKNAATAKSTASRPAAFEKRNRKKAVVEKDDDEKEDDTTQTSTINTATIGNADDFVGDEDEDSEDEQEMQERRIKSKEIVRKQKQQDELLDQLGKEQDMDMEQDTPQLKKGAMDAFAKKKTTTSSSSATAANASTGKKRRKVLKEKTTVNAQGFLVTTTEAIWEDVSSDEEEVEMQKAKPKAARPSSSRPKSTMSKPKPKAKKPSDMKQGSLMGFFSVKKK